MRASANGNFQALFESIELDQIRRGVITRRRLIRVGEGSAMTACNGSLRGSRQ